MPTLPRPTTSDTTAVGGESPARPARTVAGVAIDHAAEIIQLLTHRLVSLTDLGLTLKHVHWNVVGPNFLAVHDRLDLDVADVRRMTDEVAERIRTLGGIPLGTPGAITSIRTWDDYPLTVAPAEEHLRALDEVYDSIILDHRRAIAHIADRDPVTADLLTGQTAELELQQWFFRSLLHGPQPDHERRRYGSADRPPTDREERIADQITPVDDGIRQAFRSMTAMGVRARGEGAIAGGAK